MTRITHGWLWFGRLHSRTSRYNLGQPLRDHALCAYFTWCVNAVARILVTLYWCACQSAKGAWQRIRFVLPFAPSVVSIILTMHWMQWDIMLAENIALHWQHTVLQVNNYAFAPVVSVVLLHRVWGAACLLNLFARQQVSAVMTLILHVAASCVMSSTWFHTVEILCLCWNIWALLWSWTSAWSKPYHGTCQGLLPKYTAMLCELPSFLRLPMSIRKRINEEPVLTRCALLSVLTFGSAVLCLGTMVVAKHAVTKNVIGVLWGIPCAWLWGDALTPYLLRKYTAKKTHLLTFLKFPMEIRERINQEPLVMRRTLLPVLFVGSGILCLGTMVGAKSAVAGNAIGALWCLITCAWLWADAVKPWILSQIQVIVFAMAAHGDMRLESTVWLLGRLLAGFIVLRRLQSNVTTQFFRVIFTGSSKCIAVFRQISLGTGKCVAEFCQIPLPLLAGMSFCVTSLWFFLADVLTHNVNTMRIFCGLLTWVAVNIIMVFVPAWCTHLTFSVHTREPALPKPPQALPPDPLTKKQETKAAAKLAIEKESAFHKALVSRLEGTAKPVTLWSMWQAVSTPQRIVIALTLAVLSVGMASCVTDVRAISSHQVLPAINQVCRRRIVLCVTLSLSQSGTSHQKTLWFLLSFVYAGPVSVYPCD